jgi:hypothetical protein
MGADVRQFQGLKGKIMIGGPKAIRKSPTKNDVQTKA